MSFNSISITAYQSDKQKNLIKKFTVIKTGTNINLVENY